MTFEKKSVCVCVHVCVCMCVCVCVGNYGAKPYSRLQSGCANRDIYLVIIVKCATLHNYANMSHYVISELVPLSRAPLNLATIYPQIYLEMGIVTCL